jgi:toxin ParE1/3/4
MGFKIAFTKPAIADLDGLVSFIARDNPQAAERFGHEIIVKAEKLNQFPFLGRVVPEFKIEIIREIIPRPCGLSIACVKTRS